MSEQSKAPEIDDINDAMLAQMEEQVKLLKKINDKLNFFVIILIITGAIQILF